MKILFLNANPQFSLGGKAGNSVRANQIIKSLKKQGYQIDIFSSGDKEINEKAGIVYRNNFKKKLPPIIAHKLKDLYYILNDYRFKKLVNNYLVQQKVDLIFERFTKFQKAGVELSNKYKIPILLDDICPLWEEEVYFNNKGGLSKTAEKIRDRVFLQADGLIAVSGAVRDYIVSSGATEKKIHWVPNGFDSELFIPSNSKRRKIRKFLNIDENKTVIGFVGAIAPWHDLKLLLKVIAKIKNKVQNVCFIVVGEGAEKEELIQYSDRKEIKNLINFVGYVPYHKVPEYISAMDITTIPNSAPYQFPIKLIEYMAMGKPVVAPRLDPITEVVKDKVEGLLFSSSNIGDYAETLLNLIENKQLQKELGMAGKVKVKKDFTWEILSKKIIKIYNELIGDNI